MTRAVLLVVACILGACVPDRPARGHVETSVGPGLCAGAIRTTLRDWGADPGTAVGVSRPFGIGARRIATSTFGTWILVSTPDQGNPLLSLVTPDSVTTRRYRAGCVPDDRSGPRVSLASVDSERLSDRDLRAEVLSSQGTVVYVWAPHMPLSVDGYAEISAATRGLGWRLVPVLMPRSDADFARREAERVGIPPEGLLEADANELIFRDALVHAPSIIIFGAMSVSPVLPGYRNAASYLRYLRAYADERR